MRQSLSSASAVGGVAANRHSGIHRQIFGGGPPNNRGHVVQQHTTSEAIPSDSGAPPRRGGFDRSPGTTGVPSTNLSGPSVHLHQRAGSLTRGDMVPNHTLMSAFSAQNGRLLGPGFRAGAPESIPNPTGTVGGPGGGGPGGGSTSFLAGVSGGSSSFVAGVKFPTSSPTASFRTVASTPRRLKESLLAASFVSRGGTPRHGAASGSLLGGAASSTSRAKGSSGGAPCSSKSSPVDHTTRPTSSSLVTIATLEEMAGVAAGSGIAAPQPGRGSLPSRGAAEPGGSSNDRGINLRSASEQQVRGLMRGSTTEQQVRVNLRTFGFFLSKSMRTGSHSSKIHP